MKKYLLLISILALACIMLTACSAATQKTQVDNPTVPVTNPKFESAFGEYNNKLDGAYAEGYAHKLGNLYREDKENFIKVLSSISKDKIDGIAYLVASDLVFNNPNETIKELEQMKSKKGLSSNEIYTIEKITTNLNSLIKVNNP